MSNHARGRTSYDIQAGDSLIEFFNRNVTPYPTEVGGPLFAPVPVLEQKDIMKNIALMSAEQEYKRIMELVSVLQSQANDIKRRLEITNLVHESKYNFEIIPGNKYWLVVDTRTNESMLSITGPREWSSGPPQHYRYVACVRCLGDYTWSEAADENS